MPERFSPVGVVELMLELVRMAVTITPQWIVPKGITETRAAVIGVVSIIAMASGGLSGEDAEQLTQLLIGILCTCGLLYFSYIELINPSITVSDRLFTTLVALIVASVGLREFQYRFRGKSPPSGEAHEHGHDGNGPGNGG